MRKSLYIATLALSAVLVPTTVKASNITYTVDEEVGAGEVTGFITSDGNTGVLSASDIVTWDLTLNDGTNPAVELQGLSNSALLLDGSDLTATSNELSYDFSGSGLMLFEEGTIGDSGPYVCYSSVTDCSPAGQIGVALSTVNGEGYNVSTGLSGTQVIASTEEIAATPEPGSLLLLGSGMVGLVGAMRRKFASRS